MLSTTYDYSRYVLRTDPTCTVTDAEIIEAAVTPVNLTAAHRGTFTGTLPSSPASGPR